MITTDEYKFVTARAYPNTILIQPAINGDTITLSASDRLDISLSFTHLKTLGQIDTIIYGHDIQVVDCGNEVAAWISQCILGKESGLRLTFYPNEKPMRQFKAQNIKFNTLTPKDVVMYY